MKTNRKKYEFTLDVGDCIQIGCEIKIYNLKKLVRYEHRKYVRIGLEAPKIISIRRDPS